MPGIVPLALAQCRLERAPYTDFMRARPLDPLRLDVEAFAKDGARLEGEWPMASLERLVDVAHPDAKPSGSDQAHWHAEGEQRPVKGSAPQTWLHVGATARLSLVCQRCLGPVDTPLQAERSFLFVADEDTAARLDADTEDEDVLAMTRALDLRALVEDELLLALPLVPRHEVCPEPLPMTLGDDTPEEAPANPFAALAALKRGGPPN
jgi:uncharacterized protein